MLGLLITITIILFALKDYKKATVFTSFIVQPLTYIGSGIGNVSMYYLLAFVMLIIMLFKEKGLKLKGYPLLIAISTSLMGISYLITDALAIKSRIILILANIVTQLIFPFVLWHALSNIKNITYAIRCIIVLSWIAILAIIPELIFRHNYITDLIQSVFYTTDFVIDTNEIRFGLKRTNSIFAYCSPFGMFCCMSTFIIWLLKYRTNYFKCKSAYLLIYLLPLATITTGARALFIGVFCILVGLFTEIKFLKSKISIFFIFCIVLSFPLWSNTLSSMLDTIFNSSTTTTVQGSSSKLREWQWEACYPYFMQSPIWGNGRMYLWDVVSPNEPLLLGAESIWFPLLVEYGIMGAITYILMIICCCIVTYRYEKRLIFMPIAYFLILFISPVEGIQYNILLCYIVLAIKMKKLSTHNALSLAHYT